VIGGAKSGLPELLFAWIFHHSLSFSLAQNDPTLKGALNGRAAVMELETVLLMVARVQLA